ncbi:MAG TPA: glycosyltransferase [Candidatus Thermoplasmatota archaeon]|nr:glycosyltransferase [Candidatus Thermoplasmatota archaeon]
MSSSPRISVVLLTWNEEANVADALLALARQSSREFEAIVVDAASTDRTVELVRRAQASFPVPLRLHVAETRISVGEARNRGAALAQAPAVAFLSADATCAADWVARALDGLQRADAVFGRQLHDPRDFGVAQSVRGLRYHFAPAAEADAERFASNVNAAFAKRLLDEFPFGTSASESAVDDLLLARRAKRGGYRLAYDPHLLVHHSDVDSVRAELRKNRREGYGWGAHADELGFHRPVLLWGAALVAALGAFLVVPALGTILALAAVAWAPALRRAWKRRRGMPLKSLVLGAVATPPFDLAFLAAYARGLLAGLRRRAVRRDDGGIEA